MLQSSNNYLKIGLSLLLFLCLADMPFGYYQFVRFTALVGFSFLAYQANQEGKKAYVMLFVCLALLFQPFYKLVLGRQIWNIIDIAVGVGLLLSIFSDSQKKQV